MTYFDSLGLDKLILHENDGGFGQGSHLIVGLQDDTTGRLEWWGFYPNEAGNEGGEEEEGSSSSGSSGSSSSSSGSSSAGRGPGYVKPNDKPAKGDRTEVMITREERLRIRRRILESRYKHIGGKDSEEYRLQGNNCADWAEAVIRGGLSDAGRQVPAMAKKPSAITTPRRVREWPEAWDNDN
jgi:hypothetical protein